MKWISKCAHYDLTHDWTLQCPAAPKLPVVQLYTWIWAAPTLLLPILPGDICLPFTQAAESPRHPKPWLSVKRASLRCLRPLWPRWLPKSTYLDFCCKIWYLKQGKVNDPFTMRFLRHTCPQEALKQIPSSLPSLLPPPPPPRLPRRHLHLCLPTCSHTPLQVIQLFDLQHIFG